MERRFVVVCEWQHTARDCEFDADEIQVWADSPASAIKLACDKWTTTIGSEWPEIRLEKAWISFPVACHVARCEQHFGGNAPPYDSDVSLERSVRPPTRH
jgi:hypothetical protein